MAEYNHRIRLAKLGYRFDPEELGVFEADVFRIIEDELANLKIAEMNESKGKG